MPENIIFEDIKVKFPELRVWYCDREIHPSMQDLRLLMIFLSDPQKMFSRTELITKVGLPSKAALHVLVCRLRKQLGGKYIFAAPGWGYAFVKQVES